MNSPLFLNLESYNETDSIDYNKKTYSIREKSKPYRDWLISKQIENQEKQQKETMEKLQYEFELLTLMQEREKQNKKNYKNWLFRKEAEKEIERNKIEYKIEKEKKLKMENKRNFLSNKLSVADWMEDKIIQENCLLKEKKAKQEEEERNRYEAIKIRKVKSEHELRKWTSTLCFKSKPVPLNRGLDSLKGCISEIYENPIPWKNLDD